MCVDLSHKGVRNSDVVLRQPLIRKELVWSQRSALVFFCAADSYAELKSETASVHISKRAELRLDNGKMAFVPPGLNGPTLH